MDLQFKQLYLLIIITSEVVFTGATVGEECLTVVKSDSADWEEDSTDGARVGTGAAGTGGAGAGSTNPKW